MTEQTKEQQIASLIVSANLNGRIEALRLVLQLMRESVNIDHMHADVIVLEAVKQLVPPEYYANVFGE